ncbi:MAG: DUF262 domain-containing protein [Alphaproteobacteria bacterium]|nr:DUF262 domain-containing protein [Alphaproteobacteria bacterium]
MNIKHVTIRVGDLIKQYKDNTTTGRVFGYDGKLDIRPEYQREFVYKDKQRDAVIETIQKGFPLNIIYWAKTGNDTFEVLDGQQRTISICQYCHGDFSVNNKYFHNLTDEEQSIILDYKLDVYQCDGTDKEKLDWFRIVNIAGEKLTDQEIRNAVYAGKWLSDAKKRFSARNCAAERLARDYLTGSSIRQDYLETVLNWISKKEQTSIEHYMAQHQNDDNAGALWSYFVQVIEWVKSVFPTYWKEMKGVAWGIIFNEFGTMYPNVKKTEKEIKRLMLDDDVTCKRGIFEYIFSGRERVLSIRAFTPSQKRQTYEKQKYKCPYCVREGNDKEWELEEMEADHIKPWHDGGQTIVSNCQMLCKMHNRQKGGI